MAGLENREDVSSKPGIFSSLRFPDYRRLWIAAACSQSAGWALIVMRAALVYQLTSSSAWVGIVTAAALLPGLVVTPMAGLLADRFDRKKVLSTVYIFNLGHNILLAFLVLSGAIDQYLLLVLAIFNGSIRAIQMPTTQALLPNLVPQDRLLNAVALNQLMQQSSRMWGPLMMLPFIIWSGPEPAFFVCAGLYALALTQLLTIRTVSRGEVQASSGVFTNLVAGVKYIYTTRLLMFIMLLTLGHCALTMAFESVFPYFSRAELGFVTDDKLFPGPHLSDDRGRKRGDPGELAPGQGGRTEVPGEAAPGTWSPQRAYPYALGTFLQPAHRNAGCGIYGGFHRRIYDP